MLKQLKEIVICSKVCTDVAIYWKIVVGLREPIDCK